MHSQPFWFLVPYFLVGTLPWILFVPAILGRWSHEHHRRSVVRFCACWVIMPLLFFSISSGKMLTYILPCFPPLAVLIAVRLTEYFRQRKGGTFKYCSILLSVITGILVLFMLIIAFTPALYMQVYGSGEVYKRLYCICAAVVCFVAMLITLRVQNGLRKTIMHGFPAIVIMLAFPFALPTEQSVKTGMSTFLSSQQDHITTNTILVADSRTVHTACYVYKRDDAYLFMRDGELGYGLSYPDSSWRHIEVAELGKLLNERGDWSIAVIIKESTKSRSGVSWPDPAYQTTWKDYWFAIY